MANCDIIADWSCHWMWQKRPCIFPNISLVFPPESCLLIQSCSWNLQCVTQPFGLCSCQCLCGNMSFRFCLRSILYGSFCRHLKKIPCISRALHPQQLSPLPCNISLSSGLAFGGREGKCLYVHVFSSWEFHFQSVHNFRGCRCYLVEWWSGKSRLECVPMHDSWRSD